MPRQNSIPVRERRLIAERNVVIKEAFGSQRTGFHQTAPEQGGSITYETLYHDLAIRVAQTAFILFSTFLDLRPVSDASD
jgi:hypothetical protein